MALSPAGEALLHHARLVMQQVDHLKCDLREYSEGIKGYVRVLANSTAIGSALPAALASFLARHPDVDIHLRQRLSQQIVIDIHEARADIGIVAGDIDTQGLDVHDFIGEDLMVAVPQGHALGAKARVSFAETLDEHHISLAEERALASFLPPLAKVIGRHLGRDAKARS